MSEELAAMKQAFVKKSEQAMVENMRWVRNDALDKATGEACILARFAEFDLVT